MFYPDPFFLPSTVDFVDLKAACSFLLVLPLGWAKSLWHSYMRTGAFKPCDCKKCFFCLKGHTNGITHRPQKQAKVTVGYKCGTRVTTKKCTNERVSLGLVSGSYCRMCYRKQVTTELTATERRKMYRTSKMGCPIWKEPICKECWREGYNKHA